MTSAFSIKHYQKSTLAAVFLAVLAFVCFCPSLFVGFLSDDGSQYVYISNYLHTQPLLLLQNFASCWMQEPLWGLHYRPMMLLPLVFDVLVWNHNTIGWHITCLTIHATCTVLMFFLAGKLLKNLAGLDGIAIPFLAGALFATHPLHAESVAWLCGRVDSVCTLFYLSSFLTFLHSLDISNTRAKTLRILSQCLCLAALLTKEVGVTLPAILVWYLFCLHLKELPWRQAVFSAFKTTKVYWLLLLAYLVARSLSLGTLYGGYRGFGSAAIRALAMLEPKEATPIVLYTDSSYVIKGITQWIWGWRSRGWKSADGKDVANRDLWEELLRQVTRLKPSNVEWRYVRGHSGYAGNERCDEIAVSYAKNKPDQLYVGSRDGYFIDLSELPEPEALPEQKKSDGSGGNKYGSKSSGGSSGPTTYLSYHNGVLQRHATWSECERRVKGQSGAKFKKAKSAIEEREILIGWGLDPQTRIE